MRSRRRAISKDMRHQMGRSVANLATVVATAKARADVAEAVEKAQAKAEEAEKQINAPALDGGGKLKPAKPAEKEPLEKQAETTEAFKLYCPVLKINDEKRTVIGVVLEPETVDAQLDIYSEEVIEKAAENFLAKFNKATKLGLMHKNFSKKFELLQSYIMPSDLVIGTTTVKKGSWIMKVRVVDNQVWKQVKDGKITGFSIGGKAKVVQLAAA